MDNCAYAWDCMSSNIFSFRTHFDVLNPAVSGLCILKHFVWILIYLNLKYFTELSGNSDNLSRMFAVTYNYKNHFNSSADCMYSF